ncbi:ATP-binding cassette domain-containing protein [Comamonas sp. JC664]|uniref:ABC transporter ATP-binding protein n=1 Tax=Comamonas sp. JC664 TaxID=2801917 RepID=UPI00174B1860|nr:ATP-binding cassette domain-containing protein [Comamonas sp. JC664]MBL0697489.1 ATP-binding cassette domain-containing protein [Comamonas sp. JC664]GHG68010.1 ABC transporter ATP-binding protein [Comamonas sp. KCTC 72670]
MVEPAQHNAIELVNVFKSFGAQQVLRGVNLVVPTGTTCVLLGVSGSGKTVLMKHIDGLLRPDRGTVRVDGEELAWLDAAGLERVRRKLGILFQGGALFDSLTVEDNVSFPLRERLHLVESEVRERVQRVLSLVGLEDAAKLLPGELSGGMLKRAAFARAVVLEPKILLYDDPTAGLDPLRTQSVVDVILTGKHRLQASGLVITPDVASAFQVGDSLALLHEGRIVEHAPPEAFRQSQHPAVQAFLHDWLSRRARASGHGSPLHT